MTATTDTRQIGKPVAAYRYQLVDDSGAGVTLPRLVKAWDGSSHWLESFKPSRFQGNKGYVYSRTGETFVPSAFGLSIITTSEEK